MIGIYKFTNKINGKSYIGQSIHIEQRYKEHLLSKDNTLFHRELQYWGINNFSFEVIEECSIELLNEREQYWIEYYDTYNQGYNSTRGGSNNQFPIKVIILKNMGIGDFIFDWENYISAANQLTFSALKMYMYLIKYYKDSFIFSPAHYCKTFNVTDKTFRNAKKELLNKGYLKELEKNQVIFSANGGFKETKESLQQQLIDISAKIGTKSLDREADFKQAIKDASLKTIVNENVYKVEIKRLIKFGEDILKELISNDVSDLL